MAIRGPSRLAIAALAVAIVYLGAADFGLSLAFTTRQVTAVWPPTGVATAALLLLGYRVWPGIFAGALVANATHGLDITTAAGIAVGNTLAPLAGVWLLRRVGFELSLARLRDVVSLLSLGALAAMTVSATAGVANLAVAGAVPWSSYLDVWWVWWIGDAMGVLLVAPLILVWATNPRLGWRGWRLVELAALTGLLAAASHLVLSTTTVYPIAYAVFPFIIWTALRFGQRETATAVIVIAGFAVWGATHERGPFAGTTLDERLILLDVFMAVAAVAALALGAVTTERWQAEAALTRAHDQLELRVRERTAELSRANDDLQRVNSELGRKQEEVEAFVYIVSHDLRAPLVNLQGFSRELELSCGDLELRLTGAGVPAALVAEVTPILREDVPSALRFITASTTKFQRLIDALLALSRTGRQDYRRELLDVGAIVAATVDSLRQSIVTRGATVTVAPGLPATVGDATALGQVFGNLVANALAYLSRDRAGVVEIGGSAEDGSAHYWVKDNGVGIPAAARRRLFQVFQRFHPELAPGEGMGLAIVKRIVERHGGKVWVESEEGAGTTFHLSLPGATIEQEAHDDSR